MVFIGLKVGHMVLIGSKVGHMVFIGFKVGHMILIGSKVDLMVFIRLTRHVQILKFQFSYFLIAYYKNIDCWMLLCLNSKTTKKIFLGEPVV